MSDHEDPTRKSVRTLAKTFHGPGGTIVTGVAATGSICILAGLVGVISLPTALVLAAPGALFVWGAMWGNEIAEAIAEELTDRPRKRRYR